MCHVFPFSSVHSRKLRNMQIVTFQVVTSCIRLQMVNSVSEQRTAASSGYLSTRSRTMIVNCQYTGWLSYLRYS
jgi:hypothetical protein